MATANTFTFLHKLWEGHLDRRSEKTLYKSAELYEFADKRPLPGKSGVVMYIPKHIGQNNIAKLNEYTAVTAIGTSAGYYTGIVSGYGDARVYSDIKIDSLMIPTMISDDINSMTQYAGLFIDSLIQGVISAGVTTNWLKPDGTTAHGSILDSTKLKQRFLFDARAQLKTNAALTYSDGCYWAAVHPRGVHDLFISTSAGNQLATVGANGAEWLQQTEKGVARIESMTIGKLGGIRVVEANNISSKTDGAATSAYTGISGGAGSSSSGFPVYVMGPGAVAAVDLQTAKLKSFIKARGSAGTADPIDQLMTAGVKYYFVAVAMDLTNRLIRTTHGKTLT